jgi:hypothetical protein
MPLDALANHLSGVVQDRVVVNRTGLDGYFDLELRFEPPNSPSGGNSGGLPSLFIAVREQLGLRLEARSGRRLTFSSWIRWPDHHRIERAARRSAARSSAQRHVGVGCWFRAA